MARKQSPDFELRAQQAAYLMAHHKNISQEELCTLLPNAPSQAQVSRYLAHATNKGWYEVRHCFDRKEIDDDRMEEIMRLVEARELLDALQGRVVGEGGRLLSLRVFSSGKEHKDFDQTLEAFASAAAPRIIEFLRAAKVVGITWGSSLRELVESLSRSGQTPFNKVVKFAPVCAEVLASSNLANSSSQLASRLNDIVNRGRGPKLSFGGLPAYRPIAMSPAEQRKWDGHFLSGSDSYGKVFRSTQGKRPLIDRMDTLLTSVSREGRALGVLTTELQRVGGKAARNIGSLIDGDIGGVLLPKQDLAARQRRVVENLNDAFVGIKYAHMRRIADGATTNGTAGVIVSACGVEKTRTILAALRHGLVSHLLVDTTIASRLAKLARL